MLDNVYINEISAMIENVSKYQDTYKMDCRTDRKMKIEKWAILDSTFGDGVLN